MIIIIIARYINFSRGTSDEMKEKKININGAKKVCLWLR